MTQIKRIDGSIIAESDTLTLVALVELNKANLSEANLSGENLSGADLSEVNLYKADLSRANLSRVDLYKTNLSVANLSEAYLHNADLSRANLSEVNLYKADLSEANLCEARGIIQFGPVPTSRCIGYCVDHGDKIMVKLGCWWGELEDTLDRISEKHPGEKGEAYADMVKAAARSLEVAR